MCMGEDHNCLVGQWRLQTKLSKCTLVMIGLIFRGRADRWSIESEAVVGFAKRNPSIVIEARSSSLSLAESNESHGATAVAQRSGLKVGMLEGSRS